MVKFKVTYSASYIVNAKDEDSAIEKADNILNEQLQNNFFNEALDTNVEEIKVANK